ncbi:MAG: inactive transglutaminase family protein [Gammaproteobacteria bacterium]|nr:inactive transglutaminase family protein [Gammaproteobacteria bacterium]
MGNITVKIWAVLLAGLGLVIFAHKLFDIGLPLSPDQDTEVWTVQARIAFDGGGGPAKLGFHIPATTPGLSKIDEDFISSRFGLAVDKEGDNRKVEWAVRRAQGQQTLYYRISVTKTDTQVGWPSTPRFPNVPDYEEPYASAIKATIEDVRSESADVQSYVRELLEQLNSVQPNENIELIRGRAQNQTQWLGEIINILKGVRIPARVLWGIVLSDAANNANLQALLQVHNGKRWLTFDPINGRVGVPENFLSWRVGNEPLFVVEGGGPVDVVFSVSKNYRELIDIARKNAESSNSLLAGFSLLSLPLQSQNVYRLLIMVPIGALIVVFFRTFIGIKTFGTFMPILIALAFRETQLLWGIVLFVMIVSLGLMLRFYLERMRLLLVPRLTSILVIVVILMVIISIITNELGVDRALSVALFPVVILAMTIERMSITWEENGAREAMMQGLGSLIVACVGFLVMNNESLMYLMFVFPELLFIVLALSLLMGRYTGYRLFELHRFRAMVTDKDKTS